MKHYNRKKKNEEPSLHSPKNRYHVEIHFQQPLEGIGSVISFGVMSLEGIENYIRTTWMYGENEVHLIICENLKQYPEFEWKVIHDGNFKF